MKYLKLIILLAGVGLMMTSCDQEPRFQLEDAEVAFNYRMIRDVSSFNILDANPTVNLTVYSESENIASVDLMADVLVFNLADPNNSPLTNRALIRTVNAGEFDNEGSLVITLTLEEIVDAIGFPLDSLKGGDIINLYNFATLDDGRLFPDTLELNGQNFVNLENAFFTTTTTSFSSLLPFPISCPSNLETTTVYNVSTVVENTCCGLATGPVPGTNTATVTKTGSDTYEISDILNGYLSGFSGLADEPTIVKDVCNIIQVDGSGSPAVRFLLYVPNTVSPFGSYDPDTDTWVIRWEDAFGNNIRGTTTLTPQ